MCQGSDRLRASPRCASAAGMLVGPLRDQELVGVDEGHPAERAAEVRGGVGVGEHLVVDLAPEPGVGRAAAARARWCAPSRAAWRAGRRWCRRCRRCRRSGSAAPRRGGGSAAHSAMCRASSLTISAIATPARAGSGRGGVMPMRLILPRAGSFQNMGASSIAAARLAKVVARAASSGPDNDETGGRALMRLGLDYGGTKIEGIVLGSDGTERARARVPTPRHDYDGGIRAIRGLMEQPRGRRRRARSRASASACRARSTARPASSARATRPGCTAATCAATSRRRWIGR